MVNEPSVFEPSNFYCTLTIRQKFQENLSIGLCFFISSSLKKEFLLSRYYEARPVLHISLLIMNRLNKTEFAIFVSLM